VAQNDISLALNAARQAMAEKRTADAIMLLREAFAKSPDSADVASMLGAAYSQNRNTDEALTCFESAVGLQPTARNYFNLAALHKMCNRPDQARVALEDALAVDSTYDKARQMLAGLPAAAQPAPSLGFSESPLDPDAAPRVRPVGDPGIFPAEPMVDQLYGPPTAIRGQALEPEDGQPRLLPERSGLRYSCSRLIEATGDWWPYIGWMAFFIWLLLPMADAPFLVWLFFGLVLAVWWSIDMIDQLVPWWKIAGGLVLLFLSFFALGMLLRVTTWVVYFTQVRE
jgi:tetratricopeptide (TPR) repeat protein